MLYFIRSCALPARARMRIHRRINAAAAFCEPQRVSCLDSTTNSSSCLQECHVLYLLASHTQQCSTAWATAVPSSPLLHSFDLSVAFRREPGAAYFGGTCWCIPAHSQWRSAGQAVWPLQAEKQGARIMSRTHGLPCFVVLVRCCSCCKGACLLLST